LGAFAGLRQHAFADVNVGRQSAAHGERIVGFDHHRVVADFGGGVLLLRSVFAGEGLRAQVAVGIRRECDRRRSAVDRYRPVVAGHVPVQFVVPVAPAHRIGHLVGDDHASRGVHRVGNVDLEMAVAALGAGVVLQLVAAAIEHAGDFEEQGVVRAVRARVFDGNVAINAVIFADENQVNVLVDGGHPVGSNVDVAFEAGNVPVASGGRKRKGKTKNDKGESSQLAFSS